MYGVDGVILEIEKEGEGALFFKKNGKRIICQRTYYLSPPYYCMESKRNKTRIIGSHKRIQSPNFDRFYVKVFTARQRYITKSWRTCAVTRFETSVEPQTEGTTTAESDALFPGEKKLRIRTRPTMNAQLWFQSEKKTLARPEKGHCRSPRMSRKSAEHVSLGVFHDEDRRAFPLSRTAVHRRKRIAVNLRRVQKRPIGRLQMARKGIHYHFDVLVRQKRTFQRLEAFTLRHVRLQRFGLPIAFSALSHLTASRKKFFGRFSTHRKRRRRVALF